MSDDAEEADESPWEGYESGPFCRHWSDPADCDAVCAGCGHACWIHNDDARGCDGGPADFDCQCDGFRDDIHDTVLALYMRVDGLLLDGDFAAVDRDLAAVNVVASPVVVLLAWLSITHAAKEHLPSRAGFAEAVKARLEREEPERAEDLLRGLV